MTKILYCKSEWIKKLCAAIGIDTSLWRHIIIDIPYDGVATVYVEMMADEEKFDLLSPSVEGMKIVRAKA